MSRALKVRRLVQSVGLVPGEPPPGDCVPAVDPEPRELAREMIRAVQDELARFRKTGEEISGRPDPRKDPPEDYIEYIRNAPVDKIDYFDLERLVAFDPELAQAKWDEMRRVAREQLASGWRCSRAFQMSGSSAWERACYLAIRQGLRDSWPPRNQGEALLIDEMAQYELTRHQWLQILALKSTDPRTITALERDWERKIPKRNVSALDATREALSMVQRMQQLYQNALRMLMRLRQSAPPVIVRNAAQVNVAAGPQLIVHAARELSPPNSPSIAQAGPDD